MAIEVTNDAILIDGIATENIAKGLKSTGMAERDVFTLIGHMLVGYVGGKGIPAFKFSTDVEAAEVDCQAKFARTFDHVNWVDGVSRVQAGMTPDELGFNARFHAIESDFDAIAEEFSRMSACVVDLRADLKGIVKELEAKIADIDAQIRELSTKESGGGRPAIQAGGWEYMGTAKIKDKSVLVTRVGEQIVMSEVLADMITDGTVVGGGSFRPGHVVAGGGGVVFDPDRDLALPHNGFFVAGDRVIPGHGGGMRLEDMVVINDALERRVVGGGGTRTVGEVVAAGDSLVRAVSAGLDPDKTVTEAAFVNLATEQLLSSVPEAERRLLRESVLQGEAVARTGDVLLSTGVNALAQVSESEADVLGNAGFNQISQLADATVEEVLKGIESSGGSIEEGRVREAVAAARVVRALHTG